MFGLPAEVFAHNIFVQFAAGFKTRPHVFLPAPEGYVSAQEFDAEMGHTDALTVMQYQHPVLDPIREAIDQRNLRHNLRHSELRVQ